MKEIIFFSDKNTVSFYSNTSSYDTKSYLVHFLAEGGILVGGEIRKIRDYELIGIIRRSSILLIQKYSFFSSGFFKDAFFYKLIFLSRLFGLKILHTSEPYAPENLKSEAKTKSRLAVFLSDTPTLSIRDISLICSKNSLEPIFISSKKRGRVYLSRHFSRSLSAKMHLPKDRGELCEALSECSFSLCEESEDAILSLFCGAPSYLYAGKEGARRLFSRCTAFEGRQNFIIPFTKNRLDKIEKVGYTESDLSLFAKYLSELEKSRLRKLIR